MSTRARRRTDLTPRPPLHRDGEGENGRGRRNEMSIKEDVHRIVDELPESELPRLLHHLEMLRAAKNDPFLQALRNAPIDDEPTTPEEDLGAAEARDEIS